MSICTAAQKDKLRRQRLVLFRITLALVDALTQATHRQSHDNTSRCCCLRFAVGSLRGSDSTMFTQLLQTRYQTLHLSSPVRTQMKCHSSDLAMFLIVSCVTWSVSLCLTACPAKSYFQCWSGWSTLSHFQERGCECTSKKKNGWILNWSTLYFKLVHLIINKLYFFQDNEKRTPLHAAAYLGDAEIIELLILSGKCIWNIHHNEYKSEAPRISSLWFQVSSNVYLMYCFTVIHVLLVM